MTVTAGQSVVADLAMTQTAIALEEIVVTGAGIATEKRKLGNTIATVDHRYGWRQTSGNEVGDTAVGAGVTSIRASAGPASATAALVVELR